MSPDDRVAAPGAQTASGAPHNQGPQSTCAVYAVFAAVQQLLMWKHNIVLGDDNIAVIKNKVGAHEGSRTVEVIAAMCALRRLDTLDKDAVLHLRIDHSGMAEDFDALSAHAEAHQGRGAQAIVEIATQAAGHGRHAVAAEGAVQLADGTKTVQCLNSWGGVKPYFDVVPGGEPANERAPYLGHVLINDVSIVRMRRFQAGKLSDVPVPDVLARHAAPVPRLREEAEAARAELAASQREVARRMEAQRLAEQATEAVRAQLAASYAASALLRQQVRQAEQGKQSVEAQVARQAAARQAAEQASAEAEAARQQAEQEQTHPFSLTGHPTAAFNGRKRVDGRWDEHDLTLGGFTQARAKADAALQQMDDPCEGLPPGPDAPSPVFSHPREAAQPRAAAAKGAAKGAGSEAPPTPTVPVAGAEGHGSDFLSVEWTLPPEGCEPPSETEVQYGFRRLGTWKCATILEGNATSYMIGELKPETEYVVRVRCKGRHGGGWSSWVKSLHMATAAEEALPPVEQVHSVAELGRRRVG